MIRKTLIEKLIILNRAKKTGNISKTCHEFGISRISYYHMKNAVKKLILSKSHASDTEVTTESIIRDIVLANPGYSTNAISEKLVKDYDIQISHTTVHSKLKELKFNLGEQRWQQLENQFKYNKQQPSIQQRLFMQKYNTCFSAYHYNIGSRPFERLNLDMIKTGDCRICIAIDPISNYAFALFLPKTNRKKIIQWLDTQVLANATEFGLSVKTVATSDLNLFDENIDGASDYYEFADLLHKHKLQRIDQLVSKPDLDGSVEHFYKLLLPFLNEGDSKQAAMQTMTEQLTSLTEEYNHGYEYSYYPNFGLSPRAVVGYYLKHNENWQGFQSLTNKLRNYISPLQALNCKSKASNNQSSSVYSSLVSLFFR